jgi:hypothetical protein
MQTLDIANKRARAVVDRDQETGNADPGSIDGAMEFTQRPVERPRTMIIKIGVAVGLGQCCK